MASHFEHFGAKGAATTGLSDSTGGNAAAGDVLLVVVVEVDGTSGPDPSVVDNLGSSGWVKIADVFADSGDGVNDYHATWWKKICVGFENTVGVVPGGGGPSNMGFVGYWCSSLTHTDPYIIDEGFATFTGGSPVGQEFIDSNAPSSNGQSYVYMTGSGRVAATAADMRDPTATSGEAQLLTDCVQVVALANDQEGLNTTADRPRYTEGTNSTDMHIYCVLVGFQNTEPAPIAGSAGIVDATGELSATAGMVELAGDAAPASAAGLLTTTGGELELAGVGQPLSATGRLSAPAPFPTPVRIPEDHLGCGVYQAFAFTRGLEEIVTMLPFTQLEYERILDETGNASLTIDGVANPRAIARCCALLSELDPEEHELAIYRNGWRVWSGPITDMTFPAEQCVIQASDLSWWLSARTIHENINSVQQDLVNILVAYVQDAMSVDNSAGLVPLVLALSGQLGDRLVQASDHQIASDVIGELARSGVDWTQLDRRMLLGPLQPQPAPFPGATPYPTLIDANFRIQPTILVSGSQAGNCWYVNGPANGAGDLIFGEYGPAFPSTPDHVARPAAPDYAAIEAQYGRVEKVVTESRILDQPGIDFNAQTRYDLLKRPLVYISEGALLPSTPIPMEKLLPGSIVNVHLSNVCRIIAEPYRIKNVHVQANSDGSEAVDVQWQPLGTGETL